ncbi:MAG: sugar metabolism transcriptional regulator [Gammaproteobacteria bacterium]|nr:sugar metabolism transcriptional regulator [Gammaproteobacteria bacterium]
MILTELKAYIAEKRRVTLTDLACHFDVEPDALKGMLDHWIRKGKVRRMLPVSSCESKGCCQCESVEMYEWITFS